MEPATVGGLLRTLREMGFSEGQVGAALRAGCLSVPEAADWLLRDRSDWGPHSPPPRLRLFPGVSEPLATDAFQAPRTPPVDGTGAAEPTVGVPAAPEGDGQPPPRDFADRSQLLQQLKAEKRTRQRERELALQRIADDRRRNRDCAATPRPVPGRAQPNAIQPPGRAQCLLVIRLPSGESLRRTFPAEASLQSVQRFLRSQHPELSPSSAFLQGVPKRRFGPADLPRSLLALGLVPGATLCVVDPAPPEPPAAEGRPCWQAAGPAPGTPQEGLSSRGGGEEVPSRSPHLWGRGQKLDSNEPMEQYPPAAARGQQALGEERARPGAPPTARDDPAESGHRWPQEGHRLRWEAEGRLPGPLELPLVVAQAAEQRHRQKAAQEESGQLGSGSPVASVSPAVPSLFQMCLQAAAALLSAPSKQYRGSLASLTPDLAQVLLEYLVRGARLHPRSLRLFSGCPLRTLCLDCYPYATNQLLAGLPAFPGLRQLSLFCCSLITDEGLSVVQRLPHLQQLNLSACVKLTDNCLPFLKGLLELSHLALDQTRVTDAGLAGFLLGSPPTLSHLSLNRTSVTESTLRLLPHCTPQLRELSLKQTGISDVSALRHLEALQRLFLDGTPVSEASLRTLASHPALGCLTLSGVQSVEGDRALELVSALPLRRLGLPSRHTVTDVGLAAVCRLSGLLELDLTDYIHITDEGLRPLSGLSRLQRLSLANTRLTDEGLCHLRPLHLLEELRLDRLPVSSASVAHCLTGLPHLQVLSLASTAVGDPVARLGLTKCPHLLRLNLSDTRLTDRGLHFLAQLPLVQLNLDGSGVTAAGVAKLVAACPTLARVRSGRLRVLSPEEEEEPGN